MIRNLTNPIGTVIDGYVCVEEKDSPMSCDACDADKVPYKEACYKFGLCTGTGRSDGKWVIWKKINQQEVSL